jgi:glycosyltransferase involved in cell wall biosynthesis
MQSLPISVIVLTYNEECNLADCLRSVQGWAGEIVVVDSGSTDTTAQIAGSFGATVVVHPFENYSRQRNWALKSLPLHNDWVLHLDADHRVTDVLKDTLFDVFSKPVPGRCPRFYGEPSHDFYGEMDSFWRALSGVPRRAFSKKLRLLRGETLRPAFQGGRKNPKASGRHRGYYYGFAEPASPNATTGGQPWKQRRWCLVAHWTRINCCSPTRSATRCSSDDF